VNEPAMQGEVRVTVIATGFDREIEGSLGRASVGATRSGIAGVTGVAAATGLAAAAPPRNVIPITQRTPQRQVASPRVAAPGDGVSKRVVPTVQPGRPEPELTDMDIPTFIRRQMD
jgi:cell division protein FtsZ